MKKEVLAYLSLLFICSFCYSQQTTNNVRPSFTLKLFVNDTTFYSADMGETRFIPKEGIIQVFPGEKLFIEADVVADSLANLKAVSEIMNKDKTLVISFSQISEGRKHQQMMLNISNPFPKNLEYSALINLMKQRRWVKTSVLPVMSGISSHETWPDIITTIVLSDFHLKAK